MDPTKLFQAADNVAESVRAYVKALPEPLVRELFSYVLTSSVLSRTFPPKNRSAMIVTAVDNIQDSIDEGMKNGH